jgi:dGTPase
LRYKTQVFVAPDGDHFRVRLTHSLEVAQIARSLARALAVDEDLTEALALAHDLGHPPFGHSGEDALERVMAPWGGFDHNGHALRIVTKLECRHPGFDGLNLTWDTLEGLAKHNGPIFEPGWALAGVDAAWPLDLGSHAGLEAQIAALIRLADFGDTVRGAEPYVADVRQKIADLQAQLAAMKQERDEAERRGMERAAEAVLQTVIKFDVDWLRTATKAEAIAETLRQASAALRGETGGG